MAAPHGEAVKLSSKVSVADKPSLKHMTPKPPLKHTRTTLEEYFVGPRDITRHSKLPLFFKLHGSVLPKIILPLFLVAIWTTACTLAIIETEFDKKHSLNSILLTVLGFLVGFALSFKNSTSYQRYDDGRRSWSNLSTTTVNLARVIWVHLKEREGEQGKTDLLEKITCLNLLAAFSVALKHRIRFQPYVDYDDLRGVNNLDTYAREANVGINTVPKPISKIKRLGQILDIPMAIDNPRAEIKKATKPLGNLPQEMLIYLQAYMDSIMGRVQLPALQIQLTSSMQSLNDLLSTMDRIVNTPLPLAYSITINQISWAYILLLPVQLFPLLRMITIPATVLAAYIILGLMQIGVEVENPFGDEVGDLPLDLYCQQIQQDIDIIMSKPAPTPEEFLKQVVPLYPLYMGGYQDWAARSTEEIREALRMKVAAGTQGQANDMDPALNV